MLFTSSANHHTQEQLTPHLKESKAVGIAEKSLSKSLKTKSEEMMKLDAKLVAYLAGENMSLPPQQQKEKQLVNQPRFQNTSSVKKIEAVEDFVKKSFTEQHWHMFRSISAIKLQMEALTLQSEGTKRMELLQNEIRPIFTVECQLSNELIKNVPRYEMFHIMQFESEKFQSLTQCTRFGQEAKRDVKLPQVDDNDMESKYNFGNIQFVVWWREPGTCLNEMLGMGVLNLVDMYNASLLEQCKCININRRGIQLASLYFKICLQPKGSTFGAIPNDLELLKEMLSDTSIKHCNGSDTDEQNNKAKQSQQNRNDCTESQNIGAGKGVGKNSNEAKNKSESSQNASNNNNLKIDSSKFAEETSKVRLLKGFIYANETRNIDSINCGFDYFLICRRFWLDDEIAATLASEDKHFNYQEQFAVINDEKFLNCVHKKYLQLEVWYRVKDSDGNGNEADKMEPFGMVHLPLHQFYIAFRDAEITNHLCKGKFPVISIDGWVPISTNLLTEQSGTATAAGELKCLLAIGTEEQITNLKDSRNFSNNPLSMPTSLTVHGALLENIKAQCLHKRFLKHNSNKPHETQVRKTSDLLDVLQNCLMRQQPSVPPPIEEDVSQSPSCSTSGSVVTTSSAGAAALKPLHPNNVKSFKLLLEILSAKNLPFNPTAKGKKKRNSAASKRFPPNEAPSAYVTFQADEGYGNMYRSHEGLVYATNIADKSTQPQWQQRFRITISMDYLSNKNFILKVWKRATVESPTQSQIQPLPMDDAIIGFTALDLSVFLRGLHIAGWFNIIDFNGRHNGQLEIRCQPLEDVRNILHPAAVVPHLPSSSTSETAQNAATIIADPSVSMDAVIDQFEQLLDLTHLNLGQAIKRKFTELGEISERLRTRLVDVTGENLTSNFDISALDNWQPIDVLIGNDDDFDDMDDFERDINTTAEYNNTTAGDKTKTSQNDEKTKQ